MADNTIPISGPPTMPQKGQNLPSTPQSTTQPPMFLYTSPLAQYHGHDSTRSTITLQHDQPNLKRVVNVVGMSSQMFNMGTLMSPPDPILDSFCVETTKKSVTSDKSSIKANSSSQAKHPLPMSPPVSPYAKHLSASTDAVSAVSTQRVNDPVLYPAVEDASTRGPPQPPLFAPAEVADYQRIVDDYVRTRPTGIFAGVSPPRREDYELILTFRSQVMKHYTANPKGWLRKERELLQADRRAGAQRYHAIMPAKPKPTFTTTMKPPRQRADRVSKLVAGCSAPRGIRSNGGGATANTNPGKTPVSRASPTPEPSRRVVAPNREDKDFNMLPDFCPPISSLPSKSNSLKVEWKGQPIDLSRDINAPLLHPDEVALAGNLRLDCATYLTSKRRIFERRLQCLRTGKEFRKTDAQQACKIDVNKASKLWTAFDKVGWLDAQWVRRFL